MSDLLFKEKYLKSKENYLNLVMTNQNGGVIYDTGKYIFFIPNIIINNVKTLETVNNLIDNRNYIKSSIRGAFNYFTDQISEESKFLRIGSTITGNDINNTYNTIYPNQGTAAMLYRKSTNTSTSLRAINITDIGNIGSIKNETIIKCFITEYLKKIYQLIEDQDKSKYKNGKVLIIDVGLVNTIVLNHYNYTIDNESVTLTDAMKNN